MKLLRLTEDRNLINLNNENEVEKIIMNVFENFVYDSCMTTFPLLLSR